MRAFSELTRSPPEAAPPSPTVSEFPVRTKAIDFDDRTLHRQPSDFSQLEGEYFDYGRGPETDFYRRETARALPSFTPLTRRPARMPTYRPDSSMTTGYGGFPNPISIAATAVGRRIAASTERRPSVHSTEAPKVAPAPYLSFAPTVGRNSKFKGLTTEQQEELGGVEFRALSVLLRIVVGYSLALPLLSILVVAPWMATSARWRPNFEALDTTLNPTWFTIFTVRGPLR